MNNQLETIIDQNSLTEVIEALINICGEKADHLRSNWQDTTQAKEWELAARRLGTAWNGIAKNTHL
jgi:hypothetical protein